MSSASTNMHIKQKSKRGTQLSICLHTETVQDRHYICCFFFLSLLLLHDSMVWNYTTVWTFVFISSGVCLSTTSSILHGTCSMNFISNPIESQIGLAEMSTQTLTVANFKYGNMHSKLNFEYFAILCRSIQLFICIMKGFFVLNLQFNLDFLINS